MIVLLHVLIALTSIGFSTYALFGPSYTKLKLSYSLVGLTLASGTYLVISTHANMLSSCITGLVYLAIVSTAIAAAHRKLALENTRSNHVTQ
jgi:hypothetical protein